MFRKKKAVEPAPTATWKAPPQPARTAVVQRTAKHHNTRFEADVSNAYTSLRPWSTSMQEYFFGMVYDTVSIPAGSEQAMIEILQWVKEERARWAALALNDRAEV